MKIVENRGEYMDELKQVAHLNPAKITRRGYYFDPDNGTMRPLTDAQIVAIRRYYHDDTIAPDRVIPIKRDNPVISPVKKSVQRKYKVDRTPKYDGHKVKVRLALLGLTAVSVLGMSIFISMDAFSKEPEESIQIVETVEPIVEVTLDDSLVSVAPAEENVAPEEVPTYSPAEEERRRIVQDYCGIYQVNFDTIYQKLTEVTGNFESSDYQEGHIPKVTCKGEEVYANKEEELLLYFVRCAKQLPGQLGISQEGLNQAVEHPTSSNYAEMINRFSRLLGADRCLIYAIAQAETGWNSELFNQANNPAGLREGGDWWHFDTKEEGFIELILEVKKYNRMGAETIPEIGAIHAPLEDGNENWVSNVTSIYEYVKANEQAIFGSEENVVPPNVY